jgi:hypothetical protein
MATLALCQELAFVTCGFEVYKTTTDVVKNETSWSVQKQTDLGKKNQTFREQLILYLYTISFHNCFFDWF